MSELMVFNGFYVCAECKPGAVRKLEMGIPIGSLWKKGNLLVAPRDATLPSRCVTCNADMDSGRMYTQTLYWHHPAWYLLLLAAPLYCAGVVLYLFAALFTQKRTKIRVGLCATHRKRRAMGNIAGVAMFVLGVVSIPASAALNVFEAWIVLSGFAFIVLGLVLGVVFSRIVAPVRINSTHVHMKGVGRAFLAELPDWLEL
jgi:hypothetical protein